MNTQLLRKMLQSFDTMGFPALYCHVFRLKASVLPFISLYDSVYSWIFLCCAAVFSLLSLSPKILPCLLHFHSIHLTRFIFLFPICLSTSFHWFLFLLIQWLLCTRNTGDEEQAWTGKASLHNSAVKITKNDQMNKAMFNNFINLTIK